MFAVKKVITAFILPPGIFVVLLFLCGFWLGRRKNWKGAVFNVALALALWFVSTMPVADLFLARLEQGEKMPATLRGDVIIMLGGGISADVNDLTGRGAPAEDALSRLVTAVRAQRRTNLPVIVSGGAWSEGRTPEAPVLRRFMGDLGVPAGKIIVEDKSRDTVENARFCREICSRHGFRKPILVTSAYHMRRAIFAFRKEGMAVQPLPADLLSVGHEPYTWFHLLPSSGALHCTSTVLREGIGLLFYRLTR
jgi:uncharacterized SAM-binding protein YcdF (DUF218 family)